MHKVPGVEFNVSWLAGDGLPREHGIVLVSAKGPAPRLTEAIIGKPIKGSWWAR